jgi:uracil-DNA glycosylase family 4
MNADQELDAARALLRWYAEMGVDEAVDHAPADLYAWKGAQKSAARIQAPTEPKPSVTALAAGNTSGNSEPTADEAIAAAQRAAAACNTFEALEAAVKAFDGCPLKAGAKNTVFAEGVPGADLLVIGEAPGRDEDRIGKPFVGRAGKLLDRMLTAIDRSRAEDTLISNVIYWRPPGNRTPTQIETAICRPFVERLIEITDPKAILLAGGAPLQALLGITGIMRARGVWRELETTSGKRYPALPIFHPAFLLRQPGQKRLAWNDLLSLQARLREG